MSSKLLQYLNENDFKDISGTVSIEEAKRLKTIYRRSYNRVWVVKSGAKVPTAVVYVSSKEKRGGKTHTRDIETVPKKISSTAQIIASGFDDLRKKLILLRKRKGVGVGYLADSLMTEPSQINSWEKGAKGHTSKFLAFKYAKALGVRRITFVLKDLSAYSGKS